MSNTLGTELESKASLNISITSSEHSLSQFKSNQQGVYDQLNQLFGEQDKQQKLIREARDILGDSAEPLTDEQVFDLVNEIQYLADTWLEEYEQKIFSGKTIDEVLGLKPK